jgi:ligand-binding sensor domain-containing protein
MKKNIFVLFIFLSLSEVVFAIYPSIRNFSRKESNAGTQNWDIIQHRNDWMYFANNTGLLEYDGYHWNRYPIANYTNVRSLYYDEEEDKIYAGAFNEFGYYRRDACGLLKYNSLVNRLETSDMNFNEIWHIYKSGDSFFFQGDWEIFRMRDGKIKKISFPHKIESSGLVHDVLFLSTLEDGVMTLTGDLSIPLPGGEQLKGKKVRSILPFDVQNVLFVTALHGMYIYNGVDVVPYNTDVDRFLRENQVFCAEIRDSKLAIGTVRNGVVVKDLKTNETTYANVDAGLQNNTILSLAFDCLGNLWLGLDKGIDYLMINSPIYNLFGNNRLYGSGYCSLIKGNKLYLGTNQGLYVTSFPVLTSPEPFKMQLLKGMSGQVWCLTEIDQTLFCGTDQGAFMIKGDEVKKIPVVTGTWKLIELKSRPGYILGSSYKGFFLLKKINNQWEYSGEVKGFGEQGGMFEEDEQGNIWFSHWMKGVYKLTFNSEADHFSVESIDAQKGLPVSKNNVLVKIDDEIIISSEGGILRYDSLSDQMVHAEKYETLFGVHPYSLHLLKMPSEDIWCVSSSYFAVACKQENGEYRVDVSSFSYLKNKLIFGFQNFTFIDNSNVLVSTEDGFSWLNLSIARKAEKFKTPFQVAVKNVFITNERDSLVSGFSSSPAEINTFKYTQNSIRLEFVAPEYRDERAITYSYILENYDTDWSDYTATNTKEYTKLPKGNYTFRIRARNLLESETAETFYSFTILPPWYESAFFIIVYAFIILILLILLVLYVKRKSEEGARKMEIRKEKEMEEKEKIFKSDAKAKEKEIVALKNQKLQYELRHKSQELANSTMNVIRKNEILLEMNNNIEKIYAEIDKSDTSKAVTAIRTRLRNMQQEIKQNIERDDNWKKFAENFDMIYENYLKRLKEQFPALSKSDLKLCAYLKMGLNSKDIAPLMNMSFRSVEMCRYRLRKKLDLIREVNLTDFLQNF